jgi:tRNA A37 methylthiotransferase MiaB
VEFCSPELLAYFSNPRIYAYAHLSIQSGSDAILASMGRHYTRETLLRVLKTLASTQRVDGVEVCVGADLIVGFPGETEADFDDTLSLIHEYGVDHVH